MTELVNRRVVLAARPTGFPKDEDFRLERQPVLPPGEGEFRARIEYLSLDPYMRGRMAAGKSYVAPVEIGDVMPGGAVARVIESRHPGFAVGDFVNGLFGWQEYATSDGAGVMKVDPAIAPVSTALGVLGMPGLTAYFGLLDVGSPKSGETVVVSAASGAVGAVVGQIARLKGCRAVGIAGTDEKCAYIRDELRFDAAINYKTTPELSQALAEACPKGVDVYFDNVGGEILDATLRHINPRARIVICGMISEYNLEKPPVGPRPGRYLLVNRARMEGFIVFDYRQRYAEGLAALAGWVRGGQVKYREDVVEGLDNAPRAFLGLLQGKNFGKLLVRVNTEKA
jgi:NADPH-dependent curcumin reductase CurA